MSSASCQAPSLLATMLTLFVAVELAPVAHAADGKSLVPVFNQRLSASWQNSKATGDAWRKPVPQQTSRQPARGDDASARIRGLVAQAQRQAQQDAERNRRIYEGLFGKQTARNGAQGQKAKPAPSRDSGKVLELVRPEPATIMPLGTSPSRDSGKVLKLVRPEPATIMPLGTSRPTVILMPLLPPEEDQPADERKED